MKQEACNKSYIYNLYAIFLQNIGSSIIFRTSSANGSNKEMYNIPAQMHLGKAG